MTWRELALALAGVLAALLLMAGAEVAVRLLDPRCLERQGPDDLRRMNVCSLQYGWSPRPGARARLLGAETSINGLGYRGPERRGERNPGKTRIVMLGDSIAFGYGVRDQETFSELLEADEPSLEIVNLAVQGYGTDQELLKLEGEGLSYQPDVVILNVCLSNDLFDNAADKAIYDGRSPKPYFTLEGDRLHLHREHLKCSPMQSVVLALTGQSFLFNWMVGNCRTINRNSAVPLSLEPAYDVSGALIRRISEVLAARHISLLVVVHPNLREFQRPSRRVERLQGTRFTRGLEIVNLHPYLASRGLTLERWTDFTLDGIPHWNARGHRLVADVIQDLLAARRLVPGSR